MRSVTEWIGKTDDVAIPPAVKLRIWNRANGNCQICTRRILAGEVKHYDHVTPLADGGTHSEGNLQIACVACHAEKTAVEATARAKVRAKAKSVLGINRPKQSIQSAPFPKSPKADRPAKTPLPYRALYAPAFDHQQKGR
jgi:hypothetical protein